MPHQPTPVRSYRDLRVWQASLKLSIEVYRVTRQLPTDERYGLVAQLRRAASSVSANIAEGHGRRHLGDDLHHLSIANGSLMELETHLHLAAALSYVGEADAAILFRATAEVSRMLAGLARRLREKLPGHRTPSTEHRA